MTEFGEATRIAEAAGAEPPVLELRADEVEAVAIARKGAFYYRARHGAAGEERARELEEFAEAAFAWQHSGGSAPPPVLEVDEDQGDEVLVGELVEEEPEEVFLEEEDVRHVIDVDAVEDPGSAVLRDAERRTGPTARARRPVTDRPQA